MYRIGILGTENSHALAFAKIINIPDKDGNFLYPDFKVTALYAKEKAPSENIVKECGKDIVITETVEEMLPLVDCVMVTARHGDFHLPFALPFIKAGKPAFIDKPFTIKIEDAKTLLAAAEKANIALCGGSGCKFAPQIEEIKAEIAAGNIGKPVSCIINFPADRSSEYGGFYFYASHLVEMITAIFGNTINSVKTFEKNGHITVIARHDNIDTILNFAKNSDYNAIVYGEKGNIFKKLDISKIYNEETKHFIDMVRTGVANPSNESLIYPVYVMNAIEKSLSEDKEIHLNTL